MPAPWPIDGSPGAILFVRTLRTFGAGVAVAIVLAATACGGGGGASTTTASSAEQWAGGVCTAFVDWQTSLTHITSELKGGGVPSSSDLRQAGRQFDDATTTLTRSLKQLGKPDTAGGEAAKKNLDTLATELSDGKDKIEEALKSTSSAAEALGAITTVSATVATMGHNVTATVDDMKQLDPKGELEQAFHQAAACSPLFD